MESQILKEFLCVMGRRVHREDTEIHKDYYNQIRVFKTTNESF